MSLRKVFRKLNFLNTVKRHFYLPNMVILNVSRTQTTFSVCLALNSQSNYIKILDLYLCRGNQNVKKKEKKITSAG